MEQNAQKIKTLAVAVAAGLVALVGVGVAYLAQTTGGGTGEPQPTAAWSDTCRIFISSIPPVADVYVDGALAGKTNLQELLVAPGPHSVRFEKDGFSYDTTLSLNPGHNASLMIRIPDALYAPRPGESTERTPAH